MENNMTRKEDIIIGTIILVSLIGLLIVATIYEFN